MQRKKIKGVQNRTPFLYQIDIDYTFSPSLVISLYSPKCKEES